MRCLNLSDSNIKLLVDKYNELVVSKAQEEWERLNNIGFPSTEFVDNFVKLQNISKIPNTRYSPDVLLDLNRTLSFFVLDVINKNGEIKISDVINDKTKSLQEFVSNELQSLIDTESIQFDKIELLSNLISDITSNSNNIWNNFVKYLNYNFGLKLSNEYDQFISQTELGEIKEDWDNNKLFQEPKDTISSKVKIKFANILDEDKISTLGTNSIIDINDVYNKLLTYHQNDDNINQAIATLRQLGNDISSVYNNIADILQESIDRDDNLKNDFANAYLQAVKLNLQQDKILILDSSTDKQLNVDVLLNNRKSFPELALWDKIQDDIKYKIENSSFNLNSELFNKKYDKTKELNHIYDSLSEIGIPITKSYLDRIHKGYINSILNKENTDNTYSKLLTYLNQFTKQLEKDYTKNKGKLIKSINTRGYLLDIINIVKPGLLVLPQYGYQNTSGKIQQSIQQICYITDMFKHFNTNDYDNVIARFGKFTKIPQLIYSNWLWKQAKGDKNGIFKPIFDVDGKPKKFGYNANGEETNIDIAYFNYKIDLNAISNDGLKGIDLEYLNSFNISRYGGQTDINTNLGKEYSDLTGYTWDLNTIANYLIGKETYNLPLPASDAGGTYVLNVPKYLQDSNIKYNDLSKSYDITLGNNTVSKFRNIINQELNEMFIARNMIFDKEQFRNAKFVKGANVNLNTLHSVKHGMYDKNKSNFIVVKDNRPTGKVFNPSNITYIENGNIITLKSYLDTNYAIDLHTIDENKILDIQPYIDEFISITLNKRINDFLKYSTDLNSTLFTLHDNDGKPFFQGDNKKPQLNNVLTNFYLDNFINYIEFGNFIYGNPNEYNGVLDWNKRVNQAIRPGLQHFSNEVTKQITCNDVKLPSKISNLLKNNLSPEILNQYNNDINVADGFSVITFDEYKRRLIAAGRYEEYTNIIDKLDNGELLNLNEYNKFIESQKYFFYSRQVTKGIPTLASYQFKNSSMVLIPAFIKDTEWDDINNLLKDINADQLNFDSATKLGGVHTFNIHDKDGNFKPNKTIDELKELITEHPLSNLYIQQDIPSHIIDSDNKTGVQLMKLLITNLDSTNNTKYKVNNKNYTGSELIDLWHNVIGSNIKDSADKLMYELDAIGEDGNIKYDSNGNILVNKQKILKLIRDYMDTNTDNINMLSALEGDINDSNIPFFASVNTPKFTQIILSLFTKSIIDQKLPGMSVVLVPDIFNKPSIKFFNGTAKLEDYFNNSNFSFTNEFKNRILTKKLDELKNKSIAEIKLEFKNIKYETNFNDDITGLLFKNGILYINNDFNKLPENIQKEYLLHEYIHYTLYNKYGDTKFYNSDKFSSTLIKIKNELYKKYVDNRLFNDDKLNISNTTKRNISIIKDINSKLENIEELFTYGLTDTDFAQLLKDNNYYDKIINYYNTNISKNKFELKPISEYDNNGNIIHGYEAIINPFLSDLKIENGKVDINQLSKDALEMIGIRIPTEGKQSVVFIKVIGFINSGSSQIILPYDLVNTTGWDFDIDKLFVYRKHLELKNNIFQPIDNSNLSKEEKYIKFVKDKLDKLTYEDIILKSTNTKSNIVNYLNDNGELTTITEDISKLSNKLKNAIYTYIDNNKIQISNDLNNDFTKIISKINNPYKLIFELKKLIDTKVNLYENNLAIKAKINQFKENFNAFTSLFISDISKINTELDIVTELAKIHNIQSFESFSKKSNIDILDKETKDNTIIDIMKSIMGNSYHADEVFKQNEMVHIQNVSQHVNEKAGFNVSNFNQNDYTENSKLRTLNIQTRNLKGISVATDGLINILSSVNAYFDSKLVPELKIHENHINLTDNELYDIFGDNIVHEGNYYYIKDIHIGNNYKGNWKDISGLSHSTQISEITTNILDAVKKLMFFNFNHTTIGILKTMSLGSTLHKDKITKNGNNEYNRFLYPVMFLSQPIITDFIKISNLAITYDSKEHNNINKVNAKYYRQFFDLVLDNTKKAKIPKLTELKKGKDYVIEWSDEQDITGEELINTVINVTMNQKDKSSLLSTIKSKNPLEIYSDNNVYTTLYNNLKQAFGIDNKEQTLEDLNNNFNNYYNNSETLLSPLDVSNQIEVMKIYKRYSNLSKSITKAVNTLNVDKQSIGPTTSKGKKLFNNIINSAFTPQELQDELYDIKDELENNEIYNLTNDIINIYVRRYTAESNITKKYKIIDEINKYLNKYNFEIKDTSTAIKSNGDPILKSIYPSLFNINKKSTYPILEHYLISGFDKASKIMSGINIFETNIATEIKNIIFDSLYGTDIEYLDKEINHSLLRSYANKLKYFKNSELDIPRLFGITKQNIDIKSINIDDYNNIDSNLAEFNKLSLCDKIKLIQSNNNLNTYIHDAKFKESHILTNISLKNTKDKIDKYGYELIEYINNDSNQNIQTFSILDMYYNSNPYLNSIADDLVKYSFFKDGFKYGNNLAKIIPSQLYYYTSEELKFLNDYNTKLNNNELISTEDQKQFERLANDSLKEYSDLMRNELALNNSIIRDDLKQEMILNQIEAFHKQNIINKKINPRVKSNRRTNSPNFRINRLSENVVLFKDEQKDITNGKIFDIFVEKQSIVNKSYYSRNNYVSFNDNGKIRLFKRLLTTIQRSKEKTNVFVYYPINGTLSGEVGITNVDRFKELSESEYLNFINKLNITNKLNSILTGTFESEQTLLDNIKELYSIDSDYIKSKLPILNLNEDEEGYINDIQDIIDTNRPILDEYINHLQEYKSNYGANSITITDHLSDNNITNESKRIIFELAKSDNKTIYIKDLTSNTIYTYDYNENKLVEYDNTSPISNNIKDILYYVVNKYNEEGQLGRTEDGRISKVRANKVLLLLDYITPNLNNKTIMEYLHENKEELKSEFPKFSNLIDKLEELGNTNFFNEINTLSANNESSDINIKYSKTFTTISSKNTTSEVVNALNVLSDYTLNIGNTNSLEYNSIRNKNNIIILDYNKSLNHNINLLRDKFKNLNLDSITLGIIGEDNIRSQEFYNEYLNVILNRISDTTNKSIRLITLDKLGIYQAAILNNSKLEVLILDNQNKFNDSHTSNIKYSKTLNEETLTEENKIELKTLDKIQGLRTDMTALEQGLNNVVNIKQDLYNKGKINEKFTITANSLIKDRVIDNLAKHHSIRSTEIGIKKLNITALESKSYITNINKELSNLDYNILFDVDNNAERMIISNKLETIGTLRKSLDYIDNLVELNISDSDENKIQLEIINDNIASLKKIKEEFLSEYNKSKNIANEFWYHQIYNRSKNPNFVTKFNQVKTQLQEYIHKTGNSEVILSDEDIINGITQMYSSGEDISWVMKIFDSPFNTGITIIDASLLEYFDQQQSLIQKRNENKDKLVSLLKEYYGDIKYTNKQYYDKRVSDFNNLLDNNELIDTIKWHDFKKSYYDNQWEIIEINNEINKLDKKKDIKQINILNQKIKTIQYKWLSDNVEGFNIKYDNGNAIIDKIDDSIKLDINKSIELNTKKDFYGNKSRFKRFLMINRVHQLGSKTTEYIKLIPKESKYKNNKYESLSDTDKKLVSEIKTLLINLNNDNINEFDFDSNFFPKVLEPKFTTALKDIAGFSKITKLEDITRVGVNNETKYIIESKNILDFEYYKEFNIPNKQVNETPEEYTTRVLTTVNNWYKSTNQDKQQFIKDKIGTEFKSIMDIYKYNRFIREYNAEKTAQEMIKDPFIVLNTYIDSITNYKFTNDMYSYNQALINTLSENLKITNAKGIQDYVKTKISGQRENRIINFENSNVFEQLQALNKNIVGTSNINDIASQVYNVIYRYTSTTYMAFGVMNGIKNVATGYNMNITEAASNQFIGLDDLTKATAEYMKLIPQLISESGNEYSNNIIIALMKDAKNIFEDTSEQENLKAFPNLAGKAKWIYDASYLSNNIGEHFMQYSMFLANTKSHKVFNGKIFSKHDFIDGNVKRAIESLLSDSEKESLSKFINYKIKNQKYEIEEHSYLTDWVYIHRSELKDRFKQIQSKIKEFNKVSEEIYKTLPTVESQFEVVDGRAKLKQDSTIDMNEYAQFKRKVQVINQYLQGVYNTIDKNIIRQTMWGTGLMQFRQWMRPNISRYYGTKLGRATFNEGLGVYQKGAYTTLFSLLYSPIRNRKFIDDEGNYIKKGFANVALDYLSYFKHLKFHYATMDENSQAKVKIAITNFLQIIGLTLVTGLLLKLAGDDDKEQKETINDSKVLATILYYTYSVNSELNQMLPTQLYSTTQKLKQNVNATESVIGDIITLIETGVTYPFQEEQDRIYDRGIYKDEDKLKIQFEKVFPLARQMNKWEYIQSYMNWYKQYALKVY